MVSYITEEPQGEEPLLVELDGCGDTMSVVLSRGDSRLPIGCLSDVGRFYRYTLNVNVAESFGIQVDQYHKIRVE
jgi:hypothetical protein